MNDVYPRVSEIPFDSVRKYMTTIHDMQGSTKQAAGSREQGAVTSVAALPNPESRYPIPVFSSAYAAFLKGAPDIILDLCTHIQEDNDVRPLNADDRQRVLAANESMADHALRVLGMAYKPLNSIPEDLTTVESGLTFLGLTGMIDAARPEVKDAVRLCRKAGIKAVMITGDYKNTATAVAKELDFFTPGRETVTGAELDQLSDEAFSKIVNEVDVYARVSPEHKVRIVEALKSQNHIVAMTGDGVNDAPALKRASIGVAMGITGTDVAKATADMVITDDNFASIVSGVEEGRIIYGNIRKFVYYLLACNVAEILIIFVSQLVGLPLPLRPIQLLWLNLLTDGLPALALAIEKGDPDVMQRRPRPSTEPIINREMWAGIGVQTVVATFAVLTAFVYGLSYFAGLPGEGTLTSAQTMAFVVLNSAELLVVYAFRSERFSLFRIGLLTNRPLIGATLLSFVLLLAVVYVPFFDPIFYTADLSLREWLIMIPLIILPFIAAELTKLVWRRREARRDNAS
jgi:Ca2+-transporting ATPase